MLCFSPKFVKQENINFLLSNLSRDHQSVLLHIKYPFRLNLENFTMKFVQNHPVTTVPKPRPGLKLQPFRTFLTCKIKKKPTLLCKAIGY